MLKIVKLLPLLTGWFLLAGLTSPETTQPRTHDRKAAAPVVKRPAAVRTNKRPVAKRSAIPAKKTFSAKKIVAKKSVAKIVSTKKVAVKTPVVWKNSVVKPVRSPYFRRADILRTVVLDAGHGGHDPGAIGKGGTREKNVVLAIVLELARQIKTAYPDVRVILTRKTDVFIPLHERSAIANRSRADLFISVHANALSRRDYYGTETYAMGLHKSEQNLEVAKRENSVILQEENYERTYKGFDPNSPLAHIMLANFQSAFLDNSLRFASKVEKQFGKADRTSRGVKQAGFLVLWETAMPAVLIETGYLSNAAEEKFLRSDAGQEQLATAIFKAFEQYKAERDQQQQ
ncbi:MAG: N-acetylmuramoyl-L-alanine amidase [Cytophagaceae bacterium]|nr:N-acetylmuramoyl-L-alanine amidase [Cytophagaceae bacterium]